MSDRTEPLKNDPEFLLRCAHKRYWNTLIDFCGLLVEVFTSEAHRSSVEDAKRQLLAKNQWRNTVLMVSCYNRPPLRVFISILNAASMVPGNPLQLHLCKARDGSTALQVACACGASKEIIRALLNPGGGLQSGGGLVAVADRQGGSPLSELVIQYSLERKSSLRSRRNASLPLDQVNLLGDAPSELFDSFWSKVESLIRAAWVYDQADMLRNHPAGDAFPLRSLRDSFISVVHGAAKVAESCPPMLTNLICRCNPHMVSFVDRKGVLPLHLAVTIDFVRNQGSGCPVLVERRKSFIQKLVEMYPDAVRIPLPGSRRTCLCQAVASGLHWHDLAGKEGALQILWKSAPEMLVQKESVTQQYPFLLAASVLPLGLLKRESIAEAAWQLDTVYNLLRRHPQLLHESLQGNDQVCATEWCEFCNAARTEVYRVCIAS